MIKLFDDKKRNDLDPASHNENTYNYYDRSAKKDISNVRELLNEWFSKYPTTEQKELKRRFHTKFSSAYFELFIYQLFSKQGFEIKIHPEIQNSSRKPDFLITKNNLSFYLEAKEARGKTEAQEALENRKNQVYNELNKIHSPNFFLNIEELILKSSKQPATKKIVFSIENELLKYNPDDYLNNFENSPKLEYENDEIRLRLSLISKDVDKRTAVDKPIGIYPFESSWGGEEVSIKNSINEKAKRYGVLDKPYFICINAIGINGNGEYDVEQALWGSLVFSWSTDPNNRNDRVERKLDGIFLDTKGPKYQNVSGVLITKIMEFNLHIAKYWFVKHPFAHKNVDFNIFNLSYYFVDKGKINQKVQSSIAQILEIDSNWLDE